ncbi:MAG: hypothetical protein V4723_20310 [Pseudomonadota bacterium]
MISNDIVNAIEAIDLDPIKFRLMHVSAGEGWTREKTDAMETEYRRFLCLLVAFPEEQAAPTKDVDTFWHYHILDTAKYHADCEQAVGYFLHHYPYLGLLDSDEPGAEVRAADRTRELYEAAFGQAYIRAEAYGRDALDDASPANDGVTSRCSGFCVRSAVTSSIKNTRCQGLCVRAKPKQAAATSARCQGLCVVAKTSTASAASARALDLPYLQSRAHRVFAGATEPAAS